MTFKLIGDETGHYTREIEKQFDLKNEELFEFFDYYAKAYDWGVEVTKEGFREYQKNCLCNNPNEGDECNYCKEKNNGRS